jgi:hypothetical protein
MTSAPGTGGRLGPTRARDLAAVGVVAAVLAYGLTRFNYAALPTLPRFAGVGAALLGIGEAVAGWGLRRRIRLSARPAERRDEGAAPVPADRIIPPVPPLVAARALAVAKASALAGAAFAGLWIGFGAYVLPDASRAAAPSADSATALLGLVCAVVLTAGALWLEYCCRAPRDRSDGRP